METIRVMVSGAAGKMGRTALAAILSQPDMELVSALDVNGIGEDAALLVGLPESGIKISGSPQEELLRAKPQVLLDFTNGRAAPSLIENALDHNCAVVTGSTGIAPERLEEIERLSREKEAPVLVVPNFSIGAVLLMEFSARAAKYFDSAAIIELHHEQKLDAPSGTALKTAEAMSRERENFQFYPSQTVKLEGVRGGESRGIQIHSVRLPGLLAHQEVLLGAKGELLTLRHDATDPVCFMPGVLLALRGVRRLKGLTIGLESLL